MFWLDSVLMDATQRLSDKFQQLTGLTKFTLEILSYLLFTIFFWGCVLSVTNIVVGIVIILLDVIFTVSGVYRINEDEAKFIAYGTIRPAWYRNDSHRSFILAAQLLMCSVYVFLLLFGNEEDIPDVLVYSLFGMSLCHVAWMYFSACSPEL